jgi:thiamine pyrophosphokinase
MDTFQKALIILNGNQPPLELVQQFWNQVDCRVCADGAANYLKEYDLAPDIIIGDFDSISPDFSSTFPDAQIIKDPDQNSTDAEKALNFCVQEGFLDIAILGALGRRLDHTLYNVSLLKTFKNKTESIIIYSQEDKIVLIDSEHVFNETTGTRISLLPVYGDATNVVTRGLKYPLAGETLKFGIFSSPSNEFENDEATIKIGKGDLLAVIDW